MKIRYTNDEQPALCFEHGALVLRVPRYGAAIVKLPSTLDGLAEVFREAKRRRFYAKRELNRLLRRDEI